MPCPADGVSYPTVLFPSARLFLRRAHAYVRAAGTSHEGGIFTTRTLPRDSEETTKLRALNCGNWCRRWALYAA